MRIFIGIKFPDCLEAILKIQEELRSLDPKANYTKKDNIHLTLAFLGELNDWQVARAKQILKGIEHPEFSAKIVRASKLRDMAVLEVAPEPLLLSLQSKVEECLRSAGFALDRRRFYPHITLSRKTKAQVSGSFSIKSTVQEIVLFSSERNEKGLIYRPLYIKKLEAKNNRRGKENEGF